MTKRYVAITILLTLAMLWLDGTVALAGIVNGGFESYGGVGDSNIGEGLDAWTISGGGIDIIPPSVGTQFYWQPEEGVVSISLNWTSPATITQTISTTPGQLYALSFFMAAEIRGGPALRTMDVLWDGAIVGQPTFTYTGQGPDNMGWTQFTFDVTGTGSDLLAFQSTTPGNYGPALDAVSLTSLGSVPEPSTAVLLAIGLGVVAIASARRFVPARSPSSSGTLGRDAPRKTGKRISWGMIRLHNLTGESGPLNTGDHMTLRL
jgi:hypothetical protein